MGDPNLNIHMIKREPSPTPSEEISPYDIRAKLNFHVKRRLQESAEETAGPSSVNIKQAKDVNVKEGRQKRPYNKRTDKTTKVAITVDDSKTATTPPATQRKNKQKVKQATAPDSQDDTSMHSQNFNSGTISAGDEDEGHDTELRSGVREKEKCPDVLAMVLSMKRKSLMQEPEVKQFLAEVMNVLKT
ncbi:uncharacterized protein LOC142236064 [Haematobia irritans]|uniref:uncharacterized protein LOC142236064 n=1 Tax=Haematobia irritans TaxID=7368 RepID=UPI003F50098D